jgi:hypothetical protein
MDVMTAVITAKGECKMTTSTTEENGKTQAAGPAEDPNPKNKARVGELRAHVAPAKAKSARKASPDKKAPKAHKKPDTARAGSKTAKILDLLKRSGGATMKELMKATGWQPHSVRGFLSGTVAKKMGRSLASTKSEDGERSYSIKS